MNYPETIRNLIECFKKLPGIGEKTAERLALSILDMDEEIVELYASSLKNVKKKIMRCKECNGLSEEDLCQICKNDSRNKDVICVVEEVKDIVSIEKTGTYTGVYHVLDGLISPLDGINPEDININNLIKRVKENDVKEIILAITPSIEGETTSLYISKKLLDTDVIVSKIAHGVPMGADMEYIDSLTLGQALKDRKTLNN